MSNAWLGGEAQNEGSRQREVRWLTPMHVVESLGKFDLDPAGAPGHDLAEHTYTPENGHDGLTEPWFGRVWLNPPYGPACAPFMRRMAEHGDGIALLFARTETAIFFETVWDRADALLFLRGRLTFLSGDRVAARANSGAPSVLIAYGARNVEALRRCSLSGKLVLL